MKAKLSILLIALILSWPASPAIAGKPDFVVVGSIDNPADPISGCGRVSYAFEMQREEVTNSDYADFLNSVARISDPKQLYSLLSAQHFFGGLVRTRQESGFHYAPKPGYERLPVTFVSWLDAARYANWMHYGMPDTGASDLGTTEGTESVGAYDTRNFHLSGQGGWLPATRNRAARYWLPSCDEWVKAGFYDPRDRRYRRFATSGDVPPLAVLPSNGVDGGRKSATYFVDQWAAPFPHLTRAGLHLGSPSPFGTFDQNGNAMEWLETAIGPAWRMARGGSVFMGLNAIERRYFDGERADKKMSTFGFRLARAVGAEDGPRTDERQRIDHASSGQDMLKPHANNDDADDRERRIDIGGSQMKLRLVDLKGNEPDKLYGVGSVSYDYYIGKTEITNEQYVEFLNHVARNGDPYCLYSPSMSSGVVGGIDRKEENGEFFYFSKPGWRSRPATYISWYDAARFVNWLHFGQPKSDGATSGVTEGDEESGAYDTRYFDDGCGADDANWPKQPDRRNAGARFALPTVSEWHKAAYFDPTKYGATRYWSYPNRMDDPPASAPPPGDARTANYQVDEALGEGPPYYVSEVGAYPLAASFFGTLDQGGNVWEWLEDWRSRGEGGGCWRCDEWVRSLKGGSFGYIFIGLHAANIDPGAPVQGYAAYGFRVVGAVSEKGFLPVDPTITDHMVRLAKSATASPNRILALLFVTGTTGALLGMVVTYAWRRKRASARRD